MLKPYRLHADRLLFVDKAQPLPGGWYITIYWLPWSQMFMHQRSIIKEKYDGKDNEISWLEVLAITGHSKADIQRRYNNNVEAI